MTSSTNSRPKRHFASLLIALTCTLLSASVSAPVSAAQSAGEMEKIVSIKLGNGPNIYTLLNDLSSKICRTEHAAKYGFMTGYSILEWVNKDATIRLRYQCIW